MGSGILGQRDYHLFLRAALVRDPLPILAACDLPHIKRRQMKAESSSPATFVLFGED